MKPFPTAVFSYVGLSSYVSGKDIYMQVACRTHPLWGWPGKDVFSHMYFRVVHIFKEKSLTWMDGWLSILRPFQ